MAPSCAQRLDVMAPLRHGALRQALAALPIATGSEGLDAGCGTGTVACLLAEMVGPDGKVTGLDRDPALLRQAAQALKQEGYEDRIAVQQGDLEALPCADGTFDWALSVDCLGYSPAVPMTSVSELARVVRTGGRVAVLAWSSERLLPGFPQLEARLRGTTAGLAPFGAGMAPERDFLRGLTWLRGAGLQPTEARTFVGEVSAPLTADLRQALVALFEMRWPGAGTELSGRDRDLFTRLCGPGSDEFLVDHPDYYAFFTYTMLSGTVAGR